MERWDDTGASEFIGWKFFKVCWVPRQGTLISLGRESWPFAAKVEPGFWGFNALWARIVGCGQAEARSHPYGLIHTYVTSTGPGRECGMGEQQASAVFRSVRL